MHRIIQDGLEDYFVGRVPRKFEAHLNECTDCRAEVDRMSSVAQLFRDTFEAPEAVLTPTPNFYARVGQNIEARKLASPWAFFSIDAVFGRRVAFCSLLALALMGSFLVSRESGAVVDSELGPEAIIAQHDPAPHDAKVDRDRMMVTLASYER